MLSPTDLMTHNHLNYLIMTADFIDRLFYSPYIDFLVPAVDKIIYHISNFEG